MRKVDYATLARLVRAELAGMRRAIDHGDVTQRRAAEIRAAAVADLARDFSRSASVDRPRFLQACGIVPPD